jgi:hypothetical protein
MGPLVVDLIPDPEEGGLIGRGPNLSYGRLAAVGQKAQVSNPTRAVPCSNGFRLCSNRSLLARKDAP